MSRNSVLLTAWVARWLRPCWLTSDGVGQVDFEELFHFGVAAVAAAFAVALVDQEFVIVEREDFAYAGAGCEQVGVFVWFSRCGCRWSRCAADLLASPPCGGILDQRVLHDADQRLAVGVMARPSMPLLATRPVVLLSISTGPSRKDGEEQVVRRV